MAKEVQPRPRADLALSVVPAAIRKLERRLDELKQIRPPNEGDDVYGIASVIAIKINGTLDEVFGAETADKYDFAIDPNSFTPNFAPASWQYQRDLFIKQLNRSIQKMEIAIERLKEKLGDANEDLGERTLRAYERLDLHPEIAFAASELYKNGHYANAIEDAVKALNALVRLRSGKDGDGTSLMQFVFSPKNPILRFNDLRDDSDINEQTGFMMMFSGAVAGLRNPRAHRLIKDDPERALEFIAFVNLLAKLLDGAKKGAPPSTKGVD
jgi:uncharacterized protein (TIGR02391 family)